MFEPFGKLIDVNVPLNPTSDLNKGFAFVQFENRDHARAAITKLNATKYKGRTIAVDFSISKDKYKEKLDTIAEKVAAKKAKGQPEVTPEDEKLEETNDENNKKIDAKQ